MEARVKREVELRAEALREDIRRAKQALTELDLHPMLAINDDKVIKPIKILSEALGAAYRDHFLASTLEPKALSTKLEIERILNEHPSPSSINTTSMRTALTELDQALQEQVEKVVVWK